MIRNAFYYSILVFLCLLVSCSTSNTDSIPPDAESFRVISLDNAFPLAQEEALNWREDSYLQLVRLEVLPKDANEQLSATLSFRSLSNSQIFLNVEIVESEGTLLTTKVTEEEYPIQRLHGTPIDPRNLTINEREAFRIMYEAHGMNFYMTNFEILTPHKLRLQQKDPAEGEGEIIWSISFTSIDDNISIRISSETGEVIEVRGE